MDIKNHCNVEEVAQFIRQYGGRLADLPGSIVFVNEDFCLLDPHDDPTPARQIFGNICIYKNLCDELGIAGNEVFGLIAHEIGHIVHKTMGRLEGIESEYEADSMAQTLGLRDELVSVLEKMKSSERYNQIADGLGLRIERLKNQ